VSPFEQLAVAWQALLRALRAMIRGGLWVPFLWLGLCEVLVLLALVGFAHPAVSWFMAPVLQRLGGAATLRYPNVFRILPALYGRADLAIGAVFGSIAVGAATWLFAEHFRGATTPAGEGLRRGFGRAVPLVLVNLPFNLLVAALAFGLEAWVAHRGSGGLVPRLASAIILGGSILLQALFFYVNALVMLEGRSVWGALSGLPETWARGFWAALLLGLVLALPLLPLQYLSNRANVIVERGTPELVGWLVAAQAAVSLALWFLLAGSATLAYLSLVREEDA
jgi:hypothetical protein